MPSLQVITLPSPTNLIYFDTCFKQQRDASYVISQRVGCIKNVNRIQYFIDESNACFAGLWNNIGVESNA